MKQATRASPLIRAVCFDFGQTLVDSADGFRAAEKKAQQSLFNTAGLKDWDTFLQTYRRLRAVFHEQSRFSRKDLWSAVFAHFDLEPDQSLLTTLEADYWHQVHGLSRPFPEAESVLCALSGRYRLGLITNTQGEEKAWKHRVHSFPRLKSYFQSLVVAGQGGIPAKPSGTPFAQALRELDIRPEAAVYVGDDERIDIQGAKAAGLQPIWLKHRLVKRHWPASRTKAPVISSLDTLLRLEELITLSPADSSSLDDRQPSGQI